jgi:hypothetical protein
MYIGTGERIAYTVEHRHGCVLITGPVPANAITALASLVPAKSVMDPDVARMFGATFAMGMASDLTALRAEREPDARRRERTRNNGLSEAATNWLASGERGSSSEAIFANLTGVNCGGVARKDHPYDVSDFRRCRLLLEQVPELKLNFDDMAKVSIEWAALVATWDVLCDTMDTEAPGWRDHKPSNGQHAHKTNQLIQSALAAKYHAH